MHYLYKLTCLINGKIYIGQSKDPNARWRSHKSDAKCGPEQVIDQAIRAHGHQNFTMEVIAGCRDLNDTNHTEINLIAQYNSRDRAIGYNISEGGDGTPGVCTISWPEDQELLAMVKDRGLTSVAIELDASISTLSQRLKSKGLVHGRKSGSSISGSANKSSKLTEEQVLEVIKSREKGLTQHEIAEKFTVTRTTIGGILQGRLWPHLTGIQRKPRSPNNVHAKLTPKNVLEILKLSKASITQCTMAEKFGVDQTTISDILVGRSWNRITGIQPSNRRTNLIAGQVLEIIELSKQDIPQQEIANKYCISLDTIRSILSGKSWSHLTGIRYQPHRRTLTKEQVLQIVELSKTGLTHRTIAKKFATEHSVIGSILGGKTHSNITGIQNKIR